MIKQIYLDIEKNITALPVVKTKTTFEEFVLYLIDSYDRDDFRNFEKYWGSYKEFWNICYEEFGSINIYQSLFDHSRNILGLLSVKMASQKNILELYEV